MNETDNYKNSLTEAIKQLNIHDHICLIYDTEVEQIAAIVPFLRTGLERGEKCICAVSDNISRKVLKAMKADEIDIDSYLEKGALKIINKQDTYIEKCYFDPDLMIDVLMKDLASTKADGFKALRITGEMSWLINGNIDLTRLKIYEAKLNNFFLNNDILAVCQYSNNFFSPETILSAIHTHPIVIYRGQVCNNFYYVPSDELLKSTQYSLEVNRLLSNITEQKRKEARLNAQHLVTQALAKSATIQEILQAVCMALEWDLGEIWIFNQDEYLLINTEIWHLPSLKIPEFKTVTRQTKFSPNVGLPGRVWANAKPLWVEDVVQDTNFPRALAAIKEGLHGAFGFPILSGSEVLGTICFYSHKVRQPDIELLNMISAIGSQIGLFIKRKQAEIAIKESEERLQAITNNSTAVIYLKDIQGRYILVNRQFETLFKISRKEIIGKTDYDLFPKEKADAFRKNDKKVLKEKRSLEFEEVVPHEDGPHTYISLKFPLSNTENIIYGVCGLSTDITERKNLEKERMKIQKLESLGVLAGGIAHDFNNYLTGILGNIELVKIDLNKDGEVYKCLQRAEKLTLQASNLTKQLLTFSKGRAPIKEITSIKNVVNDSMILSLRGSNVTCQLGMADEIWPVEIDKGQIIQLINNLIINADQSMTDGGSIKIYAENVVIDEQNAYSLMGGEYVKITIKDRGIGMSSELIENIFDPYFTTKQDGSGLGLAVCYSIIKNHNGHISVGSNLGVGTTFSIYLPASKGHIPIEDNEIKEALTGQGKVLIMDDEEFVRETTGDLLESIGYETELAEDGIEMIKLYKEAAESGLPFDAVLLDLTVPGGMGGEATIKKLLEINPNVKSIVTSGFSVDPIISDYKDYGFSAYIEKPCKIQKLNKKLQNLIMKNDHI